MSVGSPKSGAHWSGAIFNVGSRATCWCTSTSGRPSSVIRGSFQQARRRLTQLDPPDLAGGGRRVAGHEHDLTGALERLDAFATERDEVLLARLVAVLEHHE